MNHRCFTKAFVFVALFIGRLHFVFASTDHDGVIIDSDVVTKMGMQTLQANSRVILDSSESGWKRVAEKKGQLLLLARQRATSSEAVQIDYQIVDISKGQRRVISAPSLHARYGELATIKSQASENGIQDEVELSMTATKVRYQLD